MSTTRVPCRIVAISCTQRWPTRDASSSIYPPRQQPW